MVAIGGELARRPLHFFFVCDSSGSMSVEGKIQALNEAIRQAIPAMRDVAKDNPEATVYVRAICFATGAKWHISTETKLDQLTWTDIVADGVTDMGKAMELLADTFDGMQQLRALPPVIVLISDGEPTDNFNEGLDKLNASPWGQKAVRIAIAIGSRANINCLALFTGNPKLVLVAKSAPELAHCIKWASTVPVDVASKVTLVLPHNLKEPDPKKPDPKETYEFPSYVIELSSGGENNENIIDIWP